VGLCYLAAFLSKPRGLAQAANLAPTDISLSADTIAENAGTNATVGTFSTTDPDAGNTFTYTLVAGDGDDDNGLFNISGSTLRATNSLNYEDAATRSIRVRSTDQGSLTFEKQFTINVTDVNEAPVITFPGAVQYCEYEQTLVFSSGGGNAISVADADTAELEITVTVSHGRTSLASTSGLTFSVGSGSNEETYTFSGSVADINTALEGLTYDSDDGILDFTGDVDLDILADDGALTDEETVSIFVNPPDFTDTFDDSDSTSLDAHDPGDSFGRTWTEAIGEYEIQSNAASGASSGSPGTQMAAFIDFGAANYSAAAEFVSIVGGGGIAFRRSGNTFYFAQVSYVSNVFQIYYFNGSEYSLLASNSTTVSSLSTYSIEIDLSGTTVTARLKSGGSTQSTHSAISVPNNPTSTEVGIRTDTVGFAFNDFSVTT
jgi:hypothetical protein